MISRVQFLFQALAADVCGDGKDCCDTQNSECSPTLCGPDGVATLSDGALQRMNVRPSLIFIETFSIFGGGKINNFSSSIVFFL